MTSEGRDALARIAALGAELFGVGLGTFVGTGLDPGSAAVAAMAGTTIASAGADIARRMLSPRQEVRVGAVFVQAAGALEAGRVSGKQVRDDGFFGGEESDGYAFAEGVMLAAKDAFEERKVRYMGNLLANVALDSTIDAATAN